MTYAFIIFVLFVGGLVLHAFWSSNKAKKENARRRAEAVRPNEEEKLRKCKSLIPNSVENETVGGHESVTEPAVDDWLKVLNSRHELAPGNPFLTNNMTQRALFIREHADNRDLVRAAMASAKITSPFQLHEKKEVNLRVTRGYTGNHRAAVSHKSSPVLEDNTVVNTILALSMVDSLSSGTNTHSSNQDSFSGGGGEFGGGGSSGSWDTGSSSSYDSGGGFDSGSFGGD